MDAKITKHRLGVLLSYDWLKMIIAAAAAVVAIIVLFMMIGTRPTVAQKYTVYSYGGLVPGRDSAYLVESLEGKFSYDILDISMENFAEGSMGNTSFSARRGVLEGNALFVSDDAADENELSPFMSICQNGLSQEYTPEEHIGLFLDIEELMRDCEDYLMNFYGEDWEHNEEPDMGRVRACFMQRNGSDKRFKSDAQKEAGVQSEAARIALIRENYLAVREAFERGGISTVGYHSEFDFRDEHVDHTYNVGINLGKLTGIADLFYYEDANQKISTEKLTLLFFNNGEEAGDAKYENFVFLGYLLKTYAPVYS